MFAYSSISQIGYIALALGIGTPLAIFGAAGTVKLAAPAGGTNDMIVGYSLGAITNGTTGAAMINPQVVQG